MDGDYRTSKFIKHRNTASCGNRKGSTSSLTSWFTSRDLTVAPTKGEKAAIPCPGYNPDIDHRVHTYLSRTVVQGGGARPWHLLCEELFPQRATHTIKPGTPEFRRVKRLESLEYKWINSHALGAIHSPKCSKEILVSAENSLSNQIICSACRNLPHLDSFRTALNRLPPPPAHVKYTPLSYIEPEVRDLYLRHAGVEDLLKSGTIWLKLAQGLQSGEYEAEPVFRGLLEAFSQRMDRLKHGKSMRGIWYPPAFHEFVNNLSLLSPAASRVFTRALGGPKLRSLRSIRAKEPRFTPGISPINITIAIETLKKLNYLGPVCIAVDDTKIQPGLRAFQDSSSTWFAIGNVGDPICIKQPDDADPSAQEIADKLRSTNTLQAEKVRLYLLIIPLPRVPPIPLAAIAMGPKTAAVDLKLWFDNIYALLEAKGCRPIALACDGANTERSHQNVIIESASDTENHLIAPSHPHARLTIKIPLLKGHPFVAVQDAKHAAKTARNQLTTGARCVSLGPDPMNYKQLLELTSQDAPLLRRDVQNLDRQDDRAAARLYAAETLHYISTKTKSVSLGTYLFIIGKLIDAWQNRSLTHSDRLLLALRCRYFLCYWRQHILEHPFHETRIHFISDSCYKILTTLCDSLIQLIYIHREHYPNIPFIPWLYSTEVNEHVFGILRLIKADFTFLDFIQLIPKLGAIFTSAYHGVVNQEKANANATGYFHTYFDTRHLDLAALKMYPTDNDIDDIAVVAHEEATSLLKALDVTSSSFTGMFTPQELAWWVGHDSEDDLDLDHIGDDDAPSMSSLMVEIRPEIGDEGNKHVQALGLAAVAANFQIQAQLCVNFLSVWSV
ncbi:uncharacterized protein EI90DRAFT_2932034 [Cantharellus anzutake]|uniref:uncharacterized protein n=1 Tax=Cantharellus anzutake TaxID=1750568 RepID=UPI001904D3DF|nr:uncharacterized protein EI90DRAFT_2932034 [Cantharellus anzutake]KAF8325537.1 hypothetical protein EI90DRAFT_2932034 [Cantharellus anzutake]